MGKIEFGPPGSFGSALQQNKDYEALKNAAIVTQHATLTIQQQKCLRGEHEALPQLFGLLNVRSCKHCRSLYAER